MHRTLNRARRPLGVFGLLSLIVAPIPTLGLTEQGIPKAQSLPTVAPTPPSGTVA